MGPNHRLKIGVLTSSRADFGIYLPLLKAIKAMPDDFNLEIIAFGMHLSPFHGSTIDSILANDLQVNYRIPSILVTDDEESIATSYALTAIKFTTFWAENRGKFDWVICLGDRYEMAAAVIAGIPFGIRFAHIGGGETTLGAIDNIYRHMISLVSELHFVYLDTYAERIMQLIGQPANCVVTGSLGLDNLEQVTILDKEEFNLKWGIDLRRSSILITIHPETLNSQDNYSHCEETVKALRILSQEYQLIITMPNADTLGTVFRHAFERLKMDFPKEVNLVENFGTQSYFSCMFHAGLILGNSSSGIVEAASFGKFVVNIGDRQKGRLTSENVFNVSFVASDIIKMAKQMAGKIFTGPNRYKKGNATQLIIEKLLMERDTSS